MDKFPAILLSMTTSAQIFSLALTNWQVKVDSDMIIETLAEYYQQNGRMADLEDQEEQLVAMLKMVKDHQSAD